MEDYKEEIRKLLLKFYDISGTKNRLFQKSTADILKEVCGIIPSEPISEHDIYEIMKELGFEIDLFDNSIFVWNLYEK
jgi:hypothetical protein